MVNNAFIKFHQLPQELKRAVTTPQAMQQLDTLEKKYHAPLADVIVRLMVKEVALKDAESFFRSSLNMPPERATSLSNELRYTVLAPVLSYLEGPTELSPIQGAPPTPPIPPAGGIRPQPVAPPSVLPPLPSQRPPIPTTASAGISPIRPPQKVQPAQSPRRPKLPQAPFSRVNSGKAAYYVFAEDEEEIAKHRDRLGRLGGDSPTAQLEDRIAELITKHQLAFEDETLEKRFHGLLLSCLRDVRTTTELQELLERSPKIGGMGYDATLAAVIVADVGAIVQSLHDRDVAGHLAEPTITKPKSVSPQIPVPQPPAAPPPPAPVKPEPVVVRPPAPPSRPQPTPAPGTPGVPFTQPVTSPVRPPFRRPAVQLQPSPRVIQDIRQPQKPVGLVQELGMLTLDDFRRLGRDLEECVGKIAEKVQLLAEESYEKRAEGVAAWRKSEVHQLYLAMGRESMAGNKSIEEVMADRKRQGQGYLTAVEFAAIADLNHQMML